VEREVNIVRDHVIAGRRFDSVAELDGAFHSLPPIRRGQVHRTHGEVIGSAPRRIGPHSVRCPSGPIW
jgi:hypothetical protein